MLNSKHRASRITSEYGRITHNFCCRSIPTIFSKGDPVGGLDEFSVDVIGRTGTSVVTDFSVAAHFIQFQKSKVFLSLGSHTFEGVWNRGDMGNTSVPMSFPLSIPLYEGTLLRTCKYTSYFLLKKSALAPRG